MADEQTDPTARYRVLPEPVRLDETVIVVETQPVPDPTGGRDPDTDFLLRNAG